MNSHNLIRLIVLSVFLCCLLFGHAASQGGQLQIRQVREKINAETIAQTGVVEREKRGIFSIIFYGGSILLRVVGTSLTLANAITKGCASQPSICRNKDLIADLNEEISQMKTEYEELYTRNKVEYIKFREANTNNNYIEYYLNETMMAVENITEIEQLMYDKLEVQMPKLFNMWFGSKNRSSDQYIQSLLGTLEFNLADIDNMLRDIQRNALIGIAVEYALLGAVSGFMSSYKKSYNQLKLIETEDIFGSALWSALFTSDPSDAAVILDPYHPRFDEVMQKYGASGEMSESFKTKFKRGGRAFKNMFSNAKKYFQGAGTGIKKWARIRNWKGFKGKFVHSIQKPIAKLKSIGSFIKNPARLKYKVKNFKLAWTEKLSIGIGALADVIQIAVDQYQWKTVADEMEDLKNKYEKYRNDLRSDLDGIREENKIMSEGWTNITESFVELVTPLKEMVLNASNFNGMYPSLTGTSIAVDTSSPLFTIVFEQVNKNDLNQKQTTIIDYIRENNFQMQALLDKFTAKMILYDETSDMSKAGATVQAILDKLKGIYSYSPSATTVKFGEDLKKSDIVCLLAALNQTLPTYDFYPLDKFRPSCNVSQQEFAEYEEAARQNRKLGIMYSTIDRKISSGASDDVAGLLLMIQTAYRAQTDPELQHFADTITEKDILCYIATKYITKSEYDLYDLTPFRPSCDLVTDAMFTQISQTAIRRRALLANVQNILNMCKSFNMCPCVNQIATQQGDTEENVRAVIRALWDQPQYCGMGGCCFDI